MPEGACRVADARVLPFLLNWHLMDHDVRALLRCAYLQGVEDATLTIVRRPGSVGLCKVGDA